ncbi:vacuolar Ca H(+) exchanger [Lecanosticta acicola]|uniref:Vacuolar calcium ion transporter n=1 Tax=Lecanosticta acicola TaxID=111012 RepID=A0AAI8YXV8_9PEZI|nr:vacuolar Ca H(+) exchanger [Lecanosticta acicola]
MSASQLRSRQNRLGRGDLGLKAMQHSHIHGADESTALLDHPRPFQSMARDHLSQHQHGLRSWPRQVGQTFWAVVSNSWINVLLVFVPFGIAAGVVDWPPIAIFVLNFLAIIPLAAMLSFATEELSAVAGPQIGGLLNATFGNAIELIVSIIALMKGEYRLIQASLLGSVLVNILLVLGCCFIAGGIRRRESTFDSTVARIMTALMMLAAGALVVPAILYATLLNSKDGDTVEIIQVSRGTAVILAVVYVFYLVFQLRTHSGLFTDDQEEGKHGEPEPGEEVNPDVARAENAEEDGRTLGLWSALTTLILTTVCVGFCAEFLVDAINPIVDSTPMSKTFIGIILLPIVTNAAEHVTAVIVSWKGKMNLALLVDLGSGLQIALFVTPLLVILAWIMGKDLTLHFQLFETVVFFLSVLVVNVLIRGGTSNYLEGLMLVGWYLIIAVAFFYYKEPDNLYGF